jgi:hypothetical protein
VRILIRKLIFILVVTAISQVISGQRKKPVNMIPILWENKVVHFGFSLGFNAMDFNITPSQYCLVPDSVDSYPFPEVSKLNPGINIQIVSGYRPSEYLEIRFLPGVSFGQRNIRYYKNKVIYNQQQKLESSFLEFPLLLKYKGDRLNNVRPFIIGGLNYRYDLAAKKAFDDEKPIYLMIKRPDLYYEMGAGLDFYLTYFKLSVELKMSNGFRNVLVDEAYPNHTEFRNSIEKMKSQIWVLAFHFE